MGGGAVSTPADAEMVGTSKLFSRALVKPLIYAGFACFGALLYGYDGTYFTAILETPSFKRDYGTLQPNGAYDISGSQQSLLASIVQAGEFVGALTASFIGDYSGRKGAFVAACAFVTIGVIIQIIPAGNVGALAGGRAVLGMGVGVLSNATPLYLAEVAPVRFRGAFVSSWQLVLAIGQVVGACVGQGSHDLTSTWAYRIPIIVNLGIVAVIVVGMFIIPESPRWLLTKDRDEKAMAALRKINSGQDDPELIASVEFKAFSQARDEDRASKGGGWASLLHGVERRKFLAVVGILIGQQIGGVQFIFSYTTTFFSAVGIGSPFIITIVIDIIEVFGVLCSFLVVNRIGRRPLLLYTSIPMFISLFVVGGIGTIDTAARTVTQNRTIAAMIAIYVYFFNVAWGPLAWAVASELCVGDNRQKIMSIGTACFWVSKPSCVVLLCRYWTLGRLACKTVGPRLELSFKPRVST